MSQLALPLKLADHAVFDSFLPAGNQAVVALLKALSAGTAGIGCWVFGAPATGKTHLLQAVCEQAGNRSVYLPMVELAGLGNELLEGLDRRDIVCIDDIERIAGIGHWEQALFNLYNALHGRGGALIVAAATAPRECSVELADLRSRLTALPVYRLHPLADADCANALQLRASHRGLELPDETARYLLSRSRRDMASLYELLDTLDTEALRAQRKLTVPFVRDVLQSLTGAS